jgi:hypothetical protein
VFPARMNSTGGLVRLVCIEPVQENIMTQSTHNPAAELHNLAAHAHTEAAAAHGKGDHLTAHELSKKARELSEDAHRHSEQLAEEEGKSAKK